MSLTQKLAESPPCEIVQHLSAAGSGQSVSVWQSEAYPSAGQPIGICSSQVA